MFLGILRPGAKTDFAAPIRVYFEQSKEYLFYNNVCFLKNIV